MQIDLLARREDRVEVEGRRQHAHDRHRLCCSASACGRRRRVAGEAALPEGVAQDGDVRPVEHGTPPAVKLRPSAGAHAEHVEEVVGDADAAQPFRRRRSRSSSGAARSRRTRSRRPSASKRAVLFAPRLEGVDARRPGRQAAWCLRSRSRPGDPGSRNGSGRSSTALTMLNIAVQAPMPSASVSSATAAKPGDLASWRTANLKLDSMLLSLNRFSGRRSDRSGWRGGPGSTKPRAQ